MPAGRGSTEGRVVLADRPVWASRAAAVRAPPRNNKSARTRRRWLLSSPMDEDFGIAWGGPALAEVGLVLQNPVALVGSHAPGKDLLVGLFDGLGGGHSSFDAVACDKEAGAALSGLTVDERRRMAGPNPVEELLNLRELGNLHIRDGQVTTDQ